MEEDTIELVDYLRVIWKRKILIIVVALVCIVAVVVMSLRRPIVYHAETFISIGKMAGFPSSPSSFSYISLGTPLKLCKSVTIEYDLKNEEASKYKFEVSNVKDTTMMKLVMKGPDRRAEKLLKGIINRLIEDHIKRSDNSLKPYGVFIEKLEADIKDIQKGVSSYKEKLKEIDIGKEKEENIDAGDPLVLLMMQNRSIAVRNNMRAMRQMIQENLRQGRFEIRSSQQNIKLYQAFADDIERNRTKLVGEVSMLSVRPNMKRNVIAAGVVGLMMSLFLAFFVEYVGKVRAKEEKKDSADL